MVIDIIPAIIIIAPIFLPLVVQLGVNPVHFGVIMAMNLGIGFVTPPYGTTLFVASAISGVKVDRMFKTAFFFVGVLCIALLLTTYVPALTMAFL